MSEDKDEKKALNDMKYPQEEEIMWHNLIQNVVTNMK